jgi:hypothetical protein
LAAARRRATRTLEDPDRPTLANGAELDLTTVGASGSRARRARFEPRHVEDDVHPPQGILELDLDRVMEILSASRSITVGRALRGESPVAEPIIERPGAHVAKYAIGFVDFREQS